ncbi:unnamed protein product [Rotaria sp. Silwood2]|nr:unnamed protein product [Rotaria sp. Silwood2]CAF4548670.1 unnamed protein product [Rotaria sp. Silwood2]
MPTSLSEELGSLTPTLNLVLGIGFIIVGTIGGIFNVLVFSRSTLRKTSCGMYFLIASISNITLVITGQLPCLITVSSTSLLTTFWYCQLRVYLTYCSSLFTRSLIVLASLDRLLLCSLNATTRSLCNVKMALRIIRILKLFSFILPIHVLVSNNLHLPLRICCSDVYWLSIYDIIYQYIFVVILPSGLMSIFSFILIYRLRSQRIRLARELRTRDKQLNWMLLSQVLFYTIFHLPVPISLTYIRTTPSLKSSNDRITIENFFSFLINTEIIYFYFSMTFILNIIISRTFRKEFLDIWKKINENIFQLKHITRIVPFNPPTLIK